MIRFEHDQTIEVKQQSATNFHEMMKNIQDGGMIDDRRLVYCYDAKKHYSRCSFIGFDGETEL